MSEAMSEAMPVYVVHWNAPEWAKATTESFLASTIPVAVTVVDNGPYDAPLVLDERVRVMRSGSNRGYAGGANLAIRDWLAGDAELCVIACHDVRLEPDALQTLARAAGEQRDFGVLAPEPAENVVSGPVLASGPGSSVTEVAWASGTCLLLRRAGIELVGGFDEEFGSYGEDIDLCYRVRAAGWKVGLVRGAHARGAGSVDPGFRVQMYVNQIRLRAKHAGAGAAGKMLVAFPLLAAADASRWIVRRDPTLLRRSGGRMRAVPAGARLVWRRMRADR